MPALLKRYSSCKACISCKYKCNAKLHACRGVRDICSSFNLVDELNTVLASLTMEAKHMQSVKARAEANGTIKELTDFVDKVSKEEHVNKPKGLCFSLNLARLPVSFHL